MPKKGKHKTVDSEQLIQQIAELTDALKRERADVINIRRRYDEQIASLKNIVKAQVVQDILPAIDNLERALSHTPKDLKHHNYVKGVQGVVKQFEKTLQDMDVAKIKAVGEPFDPKLHEAVSMEGEGNSLSSEEIVSEELQPGYTLNDEVLRHAIVKVKTQKQ
ncbi:nucleotide exchange factor GrpE [Candidatus Parcubacteria bacterium]|nr:nucleotide exchange factor GrpE [Candidatus Parcubacteria bacterium]